MSHEQPPLTRLTLIGALREGLRWEEFVALYGALILFWGRRDFGLQECDAENLRQEVLVRVWRSIKGYDPAKGRFRNWLYACTRNVVINLWRARKGEWVGAGPDDNEPWQDRPAAPSAWDQLSEAGDLDEALKAVDERGFALGELEEAVLRVRGKVLPATWKAFLLFEFFELKAREVGERLGMKPAAVNQAVHRVRHALHQELKARPAGGEAER